MSHLRISTHLTRLLFGVSVMNTARIELWDYTTLLLCKGIRRYVRDGMKVWDLGCGHVALLSLFVAKQARAQILATDWEPSIVVSARETASLCGVEVQLLEADLGKGVTGTFDLVLFNAPYLPQEYISFLAKRNARAALDYGMFVRRFSGGMNGLATITRFLKEIPSKLRPGGMILLGYNSYYVATALVERLVEEANLAIADHISVWWNPSRTLVITDRK